MVADANVISEVKPLSRRWLWLVATIATWFVAPDLAEGFRSRPLAWLCAVVFVGGFVASAVARRAEREKAAKPAPKEANGPRAFALGPFCSAAFTFGPVVWKAHGTAN